MSACSPACVADVFYNILQVNKISAWRREVLKLYPMARILFNKQCGFVINKHINMFYNNSTDVYTPSFVYVNITCSILLKYKDFRY